MFRDAKVGDKCWTIQLGDATIIGINRNSSYPIRAGNEYGVSEDYTFCGKLWVKNIHPSAFWSNPNIQPPPRPKRKVKKVVEGWVNVYPDYVVGGIYGSKFIAVELGGSNVIGDPFFIHHEYEVEE